MPTSRICMSPDQKAMLVVAALAASNPGDYLERVATTMGYMARDEDARLAWRMAALARAGDGAVLLDWRTEWLREAASRPSPAGTGRPQGGIGVQKARTVRWRT